LPFDLLCCQFDLSASFIHAARRVIIEREGICLAKPERNALKPANPVLLAVIGGAQGLKGELRVKSHTQMPAGFAGYGMLYDKAGKSYEVLQTRPSKDVVITRFAGINDRTAAEALTGTELFVERAALGNQVLAEDDYLHADLIGLKVVDGEGHEQGKVTAVLNFGAGDILEVSKHRGHSVAIPFTKAAVPDIDFESKLITIDAVAAGLVDDDDDEGLAHRPHAEPIDRPRGPTDAGGNR
jgi:16S rRNA processing protein RimM